MCGVGAILYLNQQHLTKLKFAVGPSTSKHAKLDAVWLLSKKTINNDVKRLQAFGEKLIRVWENHICKSNKLLLGHIMNQFL